MRRSAAPSQLQGNSFKKTKFVPPGRSNLKLNEETTKLNSDRKLFKVRIIIREAWLRETQ